MAITAVDKIKINKYLKEHAIDHIYYLGLCEALGKQCTISDVEFASYFTDCVVEEFRKNGKISDKQVSKLMYVVDNFLHWIHDEGSKIDDEVLVKVRSFGDLYNEYLERNGINKRHELIDNCIEALMKDMDEIYPCEESVETASKYINVIAELNERIDALTRKNTEAQGLYDNLHDSYEERGEKIEALSTKVSALGNDVKSRDKEIINLNKIIEGLNARISQLEAMYASVQDENSTLLAYKKQCKELIGEVEKLRKKVQDELDAKTQASELKVKHSTVESLIYQKLLTGAMSIDEMVKYVNDEGYLCSKDEVYDLVNAMKSKLNIESGAFSTSPVYKIVEPTLLEDGTFVIDVPKGCSHYDFLLVSDFHIEEFSRKKMIRLNALKDYCVNNNVKLILNLGDFFNGIGYHEFDYDLAVRNYELAEKAISVLPKADGVYQAILGGNHDRNIVKYGFNPIGLLAEEREDIIDLGYTHSTILLNGKKRTLGKFDVHHPDVFFPVDLDDNNGVDMTSVTNYLYGVYGKQGRRRSDSYIDILGHTHRNQFNCPGSYCFIPEYFEDGACHLRVYFDDDTKINYMVFMPLEGARKLIKRNEIVYQKILTK